MRISLNLLTIILLIGCSASSRTKNIATSSDISIEKINSDIELLLQDEYIKSVSLGVYYKGEEIVKHYGEIDKGKGNKATDKTIYEIASVTKTFVGTIIAQAEIEGKLSIEDDIRKYIGTQYKNLEFEGQPIRIKHLLTHTSELPRFLPESLNELFSQIDDDLPFRFVAMEQAYSKEKFFEDLGTVSLVAPPGTRFAYSNADTEVAAYILEKVYNKTFDELMEEYICDAIDMPDTRIRLDDQQKKNLANGYFGLRDKVAPHMTTKLWGASGAGKSTIVDMMNYIKFQLDAQNVAIQKTHQVLYDAEPIFGDQNNKIGYFWIINQDEDLGKSISHHGGANGMQNWMFLFPERDLGISIITNQGHFQTGGKLLQVVDGITNQVRVIPEK